MPTQNIEIINMNEIENSSCVGNYMTVTPVLNIERKKWTANSILRKVNYELYLCTCSFQYIDYQSKKKHAFVFDCRF